MIGIVGPADSTALMLAVARDEGIDAEVLPRHYVRVEDAPPIAAELDQVCQVILFTGRVPYLLAMADGPHRATLQYVPHSGADLYRAIVHLQRSHRGELPRVSLDTIEPAIISEVWQDLGLEPPTHVLSAEPADHVDRPRPAADITAFHRACFERGEVDVCVTCLGSVHRELEALGIPAWRISHSRTVLRDALRQAHLAARLAITEASQPAAVLVKLGTATAATDDATAYDVMRRRLAGRMAVVALAEGLQGRVVDLDEDTLIVYATRAAVEASLARLATDGSGPFAPGRRGPDSALGIGIGATIPAAEEHARRALAMGDRYGELHVALPDGEVALATADADRTGYRLRETHQPTLRIAQDLGLGPLAFARLVRALRQVDVTSVTASELARAYGIEPRSARRLMTSLVRAGVAHRMGVQGGPGAGRPQTVYRVDVERLLPTQ
ncbi:MAG: hypothetical protein KF809_12245 [Chloroflexi bacterium]|nr:hypothetical protein [Chloroflexota bacterium]